MLRIAIIEDHDKLRSKLKSYFDDSEKIECVLAVDSIELFLQKISVEEELDLILCDINLSGISGIKGIPKIKNLQPNVAVIMMTVYQDRKKIFSAISAGADGYLLKDFTLEELENQLLKIKENKGSLLSPQIARQLLSYFQPKRSRILDNFSSNKALNKKELQIINLLADGHTYQEVANLIGYSINNVRYYIKRIYSKLNVQSRSEMVKKISRLEKGEDD